MLDGTTHQTIPDLLCLLLIFRNCRVDKLDSKEVHFILTSVAFYAAKLNYFCYFKSVYPVGLYFGLEIGE